MGKSSPIFLAVVLIFSILALATIAALTALYLRCRDGPKQNPFPNFHQQLHSVSTSKGRNDASAFLRLGLNTEVDPCDDFYEYTCGNWSRETGIPPDRRRYDTFSELEDSVLEKVYTVIRSISVGPAQNLSDVHGRHNPFEKLKEIFESCSNVEQYFSGLRQFYTNPMIGLLENSDIGMWPLMNFFWDVSNAKISVGKLAGRLSRLYGVDTFLTPSVSVDWKNSKKNALYLLPADLTLGVTSLYVNSSLSNMALRAYKNVIVETAKEVARDMYGMLPITAESEAVDIVNFEVNLATMMVRNKTEGDFAKQYNPYSIPQLKTTYPNIKWEEYFQELLSPEIFPALENSMRVVVINPAYLTQLNGFLGKIPPKTAYNYLIWRLIYSRLWALRPKYREIHRIFLEGLDVTRLLPSQRIRCIGLVNQVMGFAIGRLFVDRYFSYQTKEEIRKILKATLKGVEVEINETRWMDEGTKESARAKARAIIAHAGYPEWIMNNTQLAHYYRNLSVDTSDGFFSAFNSITAWLGSEEAYKLLKPSIREEHFGMSPVTTNAWYTVDYNSITLPAGLAQSPLFRTDYPPALKFGTLGFVLAHELSHAFDDTGVQFGPNGSLFNWMDSYSLRGFKTKAQCLVKEYSGFCYPELDVCVSGQATLGENIADNNGLSIAYRSFKAIPSREDKIEGLEQYSEDQLFFLSFARLWCGVVEPEALRQLIAINPHPPDKARVIGTLRNSKAFASAFNCPANARMVSKYNCQ